MDKLIVTVLVPFISVGVEAKNLTVKTNADDIAIVEIRKVSAEEWIQTLWNEMADNSRGVVRQMYIDWCIQNNKPIPSTDADILKAAIRDLPSRKERDAANQ